MRILPVTLILFMVAVTLSVPELQGQDASSCEFKRGDADNSGGVNNSDAIFIINHTTTPYWNDDAADANDSGTVDEDVDGMPGRDDARYILNYLFSGGSAPPSPGPTTAGCDPTEDTLENCCSRSGAASQTLSITNGSVEKIGSKPPGYLSWDNATPTVHSTDKRKVDFESKNDNNAVNCLDNKNWQSFKVTWDISDPHGVQKQALDDGCVFVQLKMFFAGEFSLGAICNDCPTTFRNDVGMDGPDEVILKFRESTGTLKEESFDLTSSESSDVQLAYTLKNEPDPVGCVVDIISENNGNSPVVKSFSSPSKMTGTKCWKLDEVIIGSAGDLGQWFRVTAGSDLVKLEKIEEKSYSVFLEYVRYEW